MQLTIPDSVFDFTAHDSGAIGVAVADYENCYSRTCDWGAHEAALTRLMGVCEKEASCFIDDARLNRSHLIADTGLEDIMGAIEAANTHTKHLTILAIASNGTVGGAGFCHILGSLAMLLAADAKAEVFKLQQLENA